MTRTFLSLVALASAVFTAAARSEDAPPPIREFDIPTIERLGREMYEQDQLAWKATDVLRAGQSDSELKTLKMHGWIVDKDGSADDVRFIRDGAAGPEILCTVVFTDGKASLCNKPSTPALSPEQLGQYRARLLALASVDRRCSETYNTVALKDPERDGWLVWALASTTQPGAVVYGGHYRFTISSDGTKLIQRDALSRACMTAPPPDPSKGKEVAMFFVQLVSNTPVETTVWLNLQHKMAIMLVTPDRRMWNLTDGKITQSGSLPAKQ